MKIQVLPVSAYYTNCYIVWDEATQHAAVIDPGDNAPAILRILDEQGLQMQSILLTHGHGDHTGAMAALHMATGAPTYLHPLELENPEFYFDRPLFSDCTYDEGDTVTVGGITLRVMHTPGHTRGSVCLLAGDVLFAGDTLFQGSCGRTDLPGGDWEQMKKSLRRLAGLDETITVLPGHGPSTTIAQERHGNVYLREAMRG